MNKKIVYGITAIVIIFLVIIGIMYLVDLNKMNNNEPVVFSTWGKKYAPAEKVKEYNESETTFCATIESIKKYTDGSFHIYVKGLEVNEINYRGNFTFKVDNKVKMTWKGEDINISDLKEGDNISITFTDELITDISPTPLTEVIKVQLLSEKK